MNKPRGTIGPLLATLLVAARLMASASVAAAQTGGNMSDRQDPVASGALLPQDGRTRLTLYVDPATGMTVDAAVAYALAHNSELQAVRSEAEAARALIRQASLRANPRLDVTGARQIDGKDNSAMVTGMLPLELGGRRSARVAVAERELEMRESAAADRERQLSADVRTKFGEAIAAVLKLGFDEDLVNTSQRGYKLVLARV